MPDKSLLKTFRRQFITGILVLLPILTTVFFVSWLFRLLDGILGRYFAKLFGEYIHGVGFVSLILVIWLVGMVSRTYLGGKLNSLKDALITHIPLVGTIFGAVKQVSDGFMDMDSSNFEQVVMVEYPRLGIFSVGFVTSKRLVPFETLHQPETTDRVAHVFMPTVPNPTSGYIILVPESQVHRLNLTVEEGLKLVLSLGLIHPQQYQLSKIPGTPARITPPTAAPE
ncbi:MAG TPA: DUF502 domain-containing protein [Candidatus Glassbacteria bacterium]|nr:DUF502 domain-containing protein [Candidatus Glassbacteria bacterium]